MTRFIFWKVLLVAVAVFGLLALSGVLFAQGNSDFGLERAKAAQEAHTPSLMAINGVVGTAVGLNQENRAVVKVFTARGGVAGIPGVLDGVTVQPVVTGEFYALKPDRPPGQDKKPPKDPEEPIDPTARFDRPVPIGVSCGHPDITAGTIGCRVVGADIYVLSNNHVLANENEGEEGTDPVLQPGAFDGGTSPADDIGTLAEFVEIKFDGSANYVDAAIAKIKIVEVDEQDVPAVGKSTPSDGYGTPKSDTITASINQPVKKYGRTTGLTKGKVYAINATVDVSYDGEVARFLGQIVITPGTFSAGGDSGSLIVVDGKGRNKADDRKPVGLLFAGSTFATIANPIDDVLGAFDVDIDGE